MKMIFGAIIIFLIFLFWTFEMLRGNSHKIDEMVYKKIKFNNVKTSFLKILTVFASTKYFVVLSLLSLFFLKNKKLAWTIVILLIIDCGLIEILKRIIKRDRPNIARLVKEKGYSYPSGHTLSATCFYGFLIFLVSISEWIIWLKVGFIILLGIFILIIGYSRIYLGVHYFSDVIGGILLGSSYLLAFVYFGHVILNFI